MPLTRDNVTAASRIMLPTYIAFFAIIGYGYTFGPRNTLAATPALAFADRLMPLQAWGTVFLTCSLLMAAALTLHRRTLYRWALRMCGISMAVWAIVILSATLHGDASAVAWAWAAFVTAACFASDRSLATRETS